MAPDCLVLIPYFEDPEGLKKAIYSINEPSSRLSILVVDDGSSDSPAQSVVDDLKHPIPIDVVTLPTNQGIEHALNLGLELHARQYNYIGRMDCGDVAEPQRFVRQLGEMDSKPDIMLIGGAGRFSDGRHSYVYRPPRSSEAIRRAMKLNSAFIHPAVLFRSSLINCCGLYPINYPAAEDYAFFSAVCRSHECANLPEVVVSVFVSPGGISSVRRKQQIVSRLRIMLKYFDWNFLAVWGILRTCLLYATPRKLTVLLRALSQSGAADR